MNTTLSSLYSQPWRYHHTEKHVSEILEYLYPICITPDVAQILMFAAEFHDAVYDPLRTDNEEASNRLWLEYAELHKINSDIKDKVSELILLTKDPCSAKLKGDYKAAFIKADWHSMGEVTDLSLDKKYQQWLTEYEDNIFREFQYLEVETYMHKRKEFLTNSWFDGLITESVYDYLIPLVHRKRRIGIFAGSFFPFHIGHLNVLRKAEKMFDKVIIAQGQNAEKQYEGTFNNLRQILPHHQIDSYSGLLADYLKSKKSPYCEPVLIRGIRNAVDLEYETALSRFLADQGAGDIPITYIFPDKEVEYISSSRVRVLPDSEAKKYLPKSQ